MSLVLCMHIVQDLDPVSAAVVLVDRQVTDDIPVIKINLPVDGKVDTC